jgi:hypothetical protein
MEKFELVVEWRSGKWTLKTGKRLIGELRPRTTTAMEEEGSKSNCGWEFLDLMHAGGIERVQEGFELKSREKERKGTDNTNE